MIPNIHYFQPKTSRQLVQEISRKITEKNKLLELKSLLDNNDPTQLPDISNKEEKKNKEENKEKAKKKKKKKQKPKKVVVKTPPKPSKDMIFGVISRTQRAKLQDPEHVRTI